MKNFDVVQLIMQKDSSAYPRNTYEAFFEITRRSMSDTYTFFSLGSLVCSYGTLFSFEIVLGMDGFLLARNNEVRFFHCDINIIKYVFGEVSAGRMKYI